MGGEATVPLILSDLTWSLGNNLFGWLGFEGTINFWYEVFTGTERFRPLSAKSGSFGVDLGGVMADMVPAPVWTFQHTVFAKAGTFEGVQPARVFVPDVAFTPSLYGSVIRVVPASGGSYLLASGAGAGTNPLTKTGTGARGPFGWTRAGGKAQPTYPGSPIPVFPVGGLHADASISGINSPQTATATENLPTGALLTGTVTSGDPAVLLPAGTSGLAIGDVVLVTGGPAPVIAAVSALPDDGTSLRVVLKGGGALAAVPTGTRVRLRRLSAVRSENESAVAGHPDLLDAHAVAGPYPASAPLRLSQGGAVVGSVLATGLQASVTLAGAQPTGLTAPLTIYQAAEAGAPATVTLAPPHTLTYPSGTTPPAVGQFIAVRGTTGDPVVAAVTDVPSAGQVNVDADLSSLTAPLAARSIANGNRLGTAAAVPGADLVLTYVPDAPAQTTGLTYVRIEGASGPVSVRRVASVGFDALGVSPSLPGNTGAPYAVEVFDYSGTDASNLAVETVSGITLSPTSALTGASCLALVCLTGSPFTSTPVIAGGSASGLVVTFTTASRPVALAPSQILLASTGGASPTPCLVTGVRLTVELDRTLALSASGLSAVLLTPVGLTYDAAPVDATTVSVLPRVTAGGVTTRSQMPRFAAGEMLKLDGVVAGKSSIYRITAVDGTTLTLADGDPLPASGSLTATRLVPGPQNTSAARAGINGATAGTSPAGNALVAFDVWAATQLANSAIVGIVDAGVCHPAVVTTSTQIAVTLGAPLSGSGPVALGAPTFAPMLADGSTTAWLADIVRTPTGILAPFVTATATSGTIVAVPFTASPTVTASGNVSSGTVRPPGSPEDFELDRYDALAEHELRHTVQAAMWGQMITGFLPIGLLENIADAISADVERPAYSAYLSGTLAGNRLTIADLAGVDISRGTTLQLSAASGSPVEVDVTSTGPGAGEFLLSQDGSLTDGPVSVRRKTPAGWVGTLDGVLRVLTYGGLLNLTTVNLYEGLAYLIAHFIYWIERKAGHQDSAFAATVADSGSTLNLAGDDGATALRSAQRVTVKQGDTTVWRSVSSVDGRTIHLQSPVGFTGDVQVYAFTMREPGSTWDWHDYYPATMPDATRPGSLQVQSVDGSTLTLAVHDIVAVTYDTAPAPAGAGTSAGAQAPPVGGSKRTTVVSVGASGVVEIADALPVTASGIRIAKIDSSDPLSNADTAGMEAMGLGRFTRWVTDPYGQLQLTLSGKRGSFADVLGRIGGTLFSTRSFFALFGYWQYDNVLARALTSAQNSHMEQDASEHSGDTYNGIGRLLPNAGGPAYVGDIARYWLTDDGARRTFGSFVAASMGDSPGVWLAAPTSPLLMPDVKAETSTPPATSASPTPNMGATAGDAGADAVPFTLMTNPTTLPAGSAAAQGAVSGGYPPLVRGWIPSSGALERTAGMYVAFTRPPAAGGKHRVTVGDNGIWLTARQAQDAGASTVHYEVAPQAVTVTVAGRAVPDGGSITVLPTQRIAVAVTPNGSRKYALLLQRPTNGTVLKGTADDQVAVAGASIGTETIEVVRRYSQSAGSFNDPELAVHGVHFDADLDIPVSSFTVTVANSLPLLATADPAAAAITELRPGGEAFLLVQPHVAVTTRVASTAPVGNPQPPAAAGTAGPGLDITAPPVPPALTDYLAGGLLVRVSPPADGPPEEPTDFSLVTVVGDVGSPVNIASALRVTPWFRLQPPAGAADWNVARGATVTLPTTDAVTAGSATIDPPDGISVSVGASGVTVAVQPAAAPGLRVILARDAADATHAARRTIRIV
jgi:hypothetical protein